MISAWFHRRNATYRNLVQFLRARLQPTIEMHFAKLVEGAHTFDERDTLYECLVRNHFRQADYKRN